MKYQQDDTLMTLNTEMKTEDGRKDRIHAMHRTASDLCRNVHRRPGLLSEQKKSEDDMNQQRLSLLESLESFSFGKKKKKKKRSSKKKKKSKEGFDVQIAAQRVDSELTKKQFDARRNRLAALRSKSQRIQSVAAFNLVSQRTMEEALQNEGTNILDEASRTIDEDMIAETLWLFSPTLSSHAIKWCLTDEVWRHVWFDFIGSTIVVHDYAFAHSVHTIQVDRSVRLFNRVDEIEKVSERVGVELPGPIPSEWKDNYTERNLMFLHHPHLEDNDNLEAKIIFIVENDSADIWKRVVQKAANEEHFDEEEVRDVDKIRNLAKDMLWEADTDGDGSISFKEMMLTVTLVHESETDTVRVVI